MTVQTMEAQKIGQAFMNLVMVSRLMGHRDIADTAKDYLQPHAQELTYTEEQWFVLRALTSPPDQVISDTEMLPLATAMVNAMPTPQEAQ